MAVYELTLPLDDATVEKLQVGDIIYLNGQVCTARDIAHLKLRELADAGKPFPEDLRGGAIFHAGPVMKKDAQGKWYLSVIGPTTSIRMEPHADFVGQQGVKVIIGKDGGNNGGRQLFSSRRRPGNFDNCRQHRQPTAAKASRHHTSSAENIPKYYYHNAVSKDC